MVWSNRSRYAIFAYHLFCLIVILFLLSGCVNPWVFKNHPTTHLNTTWSTAHCDVQFYIPADYSGVRGMIQAYPKDVSVNLDISPYYSIVNIVEMKNLQEGNRYSDKDCLEKWRVLAIKPGKYTVRIEETTYFTPGEILTFYCVNGNHLDDPEYLQAEIAKLRQEEKKSQWIARGILTGVVVLVIAVVVLVLRRKRRRK